MKTVLVAGNIDVISQKGYERLGRDFRMILAGQSDRILKNNAKITYIKTSTEEEKFNQLFDAYSVDEVIFITGHVDNVGQVTSEIDELELLYELCKSHLVEKVVVLTGKDGKNYSENSHTYKMVGDRVYADNRAFMGWQIEEKVLYHAISQKIKSVVLRCPFIFNEERYDTYIGKIIRNIQKGKEVHLPFDKESQMDLVDEEDFLGLCYAILDDETDETGIYDVCSGFYHTWDEFSTKAGEWKHDTRIIYDHVPNFYSKEEFPYELRRYYGFIPLTDVFTKLDEYYKAYHQGEEAKQKEEISIWSKVKYHFEKHILKYIELIVLFLLAEWISTYTSQSVYFKYIDVRICYVLIMGSMHGMRMGVISAILECIALVFRFREIGISGTLLFYNIENWIPFMFYLMVGSITGFISDKHEAEQNFSKKEYQLLHDKYLFLNEVYHGAIENKTEYKRQVLGFTDSFGKIFNAVQNLDSELPQSILLKGLQTIESILDNRSVAIYTIDKTQTFARLSACSAILMRRLDKTKRIDDIRDLYEGVRKDGIWKNSVITEEGPIYAGGVFKGDAISILIVLYSARPEQMNMRYMNILRILCGLIQTSFLRAVEYQDMKNKYYPGTRVVYTDQFRQLLSTFYEMESSELAQYMLLQLEETDKELVTEKLKGIIRDTDIAGTDENDQIFLLLTQVDQNNIGIVTKRLDNREIHYTIVQDKGKSWLQS